jgi:lysophospholipase L1-like esterase
MRFLALGDSYTIGEGVAAEGRWPMVLARLAREGGVPLEDPTIIAVTGWTTDELGAGIDQAAPERPFDLVTLLIGVNNQYRGRPLDEYRQQLRGLLERAVGLAGGDAGHVIVVSIPDWGVTPFAEERDRATIAAAIDRFNTVGRAEAARRGGRYVDVTGASRASPGLLVADGLHPSADAYLDWARLILPEALVALGMV